MLRIKVDVKKVLVFFEGWKCSFEVRELSK